MKRPSDALSVGARLDLPALFLILALGGCAPPTPLGVAPEVDCGVLSEGEVWQQTLEVRNDGAEPLARVRVVSTCGCLEAEPAVISIPPGDRVRVALRVDPGGRIGTYEKRVAFRVGDQELGSTTIRFTVGHNVIVSPRTLDLQTFLCADGAQGNVTIKYLGESPLPALSVTTSPEIEARLAPLDDGTGWRLQLSARPSSPGRVAGKARLIFEEAEVSVAVIGRATEVLAPMAPRVILGRDVRVGTPGRVDLRLGRGWEPASFGVKSSDNLTARLVVQGEAVALEVTVARVEARGRIDGWVEVFLLTNEKEKVRLPVLGYALER